MIRMKVCLMGANAVGKTSLVSRFVFGIFSDVYQTTLGVKIDRKTIEVAGLDLDLVFWDLEGEDEFAQIRLAYLRGASGYVLVADGTRARTLDVARRLKREAARVLGDVPFVLLVNKLDRFDEWEVSAQDIAQLKEQGWRVQRSSARTGSGVVEAVDDLGRQLLHAAAWSQGKEAW
jgi:small GTP-binding protein